MEERYRSVLYTLAISNSMISAQRAAGICTAVSMADFQGSEAMAYSLSSAFSAIVLFHFFNRKGKYDESKEKWQS